MPRALNLMMSERGHGVLSQKQLDYLRRNGFSEDIKNVAGGCLMSSLGGANEQLVAYLEDLGTVYRYFNEILALLPELDADHLELVARYFDPLDCGQDLPQDDRLEGGKPVSRPPIPFDCCEVQDYVDPSIRLRIFVTACLLLQRRGAKHVSPYPRLRGLQASRVAQVACGYNHTCARTESGQVFSWGSNSKGQLGQNNPDLDYCVRAWALPKAHQSQKLILLLLSVLISPLPAAWTHSATNPSTSFRAAAITVLQLERVMRLPYLSGVIIRLVNLPLEIERIAGRPAS